jgi:hypothetical protein
LRDQFAGLFEQLLNESQARAQISAVGELRSLIGSVQALLNEKVDSASPKSPVVEALLLTNNPLFARLRRLLRAPYRLFFANVTELDEVLSAFNYESVGQKAWDSAADREWVRNTGDSTVSLLKVPIDFFKEDDSIALEVRDSGLIARVTIEERA